MEEDYNYDFPKNGGGSIFGCGAAPIWCVWFIICISIAGKIDDSVGFVLFIFLAIIPLIIMIIVAMSVQANFTADDHAVTFRYLLKKTVIPYENIKSIEVNAELREMRSRGGVNRYYAEVISFHCDGEKEYVFGGNLDIDFEAILKDPNYLQKQTENSKFSRLKAFIEGKMT